VSSEERTYDGRILEDEEPLSAREAACDKFQNWWPMSVYGPAHIVISDHNTEDGYIAFCLEGIFRILEYRCLYDESPDERKELYHSSDDKHSTRELIETGKFLSRLLLIDDEGSCSNEGVDRPQVTISYRSVAPDVIQERIDRELLESNWPRDGKAKDLG